MRKLKEHLKEQLKEQPSEMRATRIMAAQAFSRAAGAPLVHGNSIRLLRDAKENYPAWFDAIRSAEKNVYFENYIIRSDKIGRAVLRHAYCESKRGCSGKTAV